MCNHTEQNEHLVLSKEKNDKRLVFIGQLKFDFFSSDFKSNENGIVIRERERMTVLVKAPMHIVSEH